MYRWRQLTRAQRQEVMQYRRQHEQPWHSPPHIVGDTTYYLVTSACYEHRPLIGTSPQRMADFEGDLLQNLRENARTVFAWTILPNHYHTLLDTPNIKQVLRELGKLHGRTSYAWNGEEQCRGRTVWFNAAETAMKSDRHFWATMNYVLHNAVRHGYVTQWQDWPFCNAEEYLQSVGRERAETVWRECPVLDYGADWDPPEL